jgi:HEAT repeat protein
MRARARLGRAATQAALVWSALLLARCGESPEERVARQESMVSSIIDEGMRAPVPLVRAETVRLLAQTRDERFRDRFAAALQDTSPMVQTAATEALLRMGAPDAEAVALSKFSGGTPDQRLRILGIAVASGRPPFRLEAVRRALRDPDARVRLAALTDAAGAQIPLSATDLVRLVDDADPGVVDLAVARLAATDLGAATELVLKRLRSDDDAVRSSGLSLAMRVASPDLWPLLRSYARGAEGPERQAAAIALAFMGDASVEDEVRGVVQTAPAPVAARALVAVVRIGSERARQQPGLYRKDPREELRRAALEALVHIEAPLDEFVPFFEDSDPRIGEEAIRHLQQRDPRFAADALTRALNAAARPEQVLLALFHAGQRMDTVPLLAASAERLEQFSDSRNVTISNLSTRLLLSVSSPAKHLERIEAHASDSAIYALIEATLRADAPESALYGRHLDSDVYVIRLASALGIWRLGARYAPEPGG